jgi:hypothetical protein
VHAERFRELLVHLTFLGRRFAEQDGDHGGVMHTLQVLVDVGANKGVQEAEEAKSEQKASMVGLRRSRLMLHDPVPCKVYLLLLLALEAEEELDGLRRAIVEQRPLHNFVIIFDLQGNRRLIRSAKALLANLFEDQSLRGDGVFGSELEEASAGHFRELPHIGLLQRLLLPFLLLFLLQGLKVGYFRHFQGHLVLGAQEIRDFSHSRILRGKLFDLHFDLNGGISLTVVRWNAALGACSHLAVFVEQTRLLRASLPSILHWMHLSEATSRQNAPLRHLIR